MNATANVVDRSFESVRAERARRERIAKTDTQPGIFSNMADGIFALDYAMSCVTHNGATFDGNSRQLVMSIVGLIADNADGIEMFDDEIARHAGCTRETVCRWRKAYKASAWTINFNFLEIVEGAYNKAKERYDPTRYAFPLKGFIETVISEARASATYERDRCEALRSAVHGALDTLPDVPYSSRTRNPKPRTRAIDPLRDLERAAKNLEKARVGFIDLPAAKFDRDTRLKLLELQEKINALAASLPANGDTEEDSYMCDISSHTPPPRLWRSQKKKKNCERGGR